MIRLIVRAYDRYLTWKYNKSFDKAERIHIRRAELWSKYYKKRYLRD